MTQKPTRGSLSIPDVAAAALCMAEAILAQELPGGKRVGREWEALNPTRADNRTGSFKVNINTGLWSDFADPANVARGGDLVSLMAYLHGTTQLGAASYINERYLHGSAARQTAKPPEKKRKNRVWTPILPVPVDAPDPPRAHIKRGVYVNRWAYLDGASALLGYVCRFEKTLDDGTVDKDIIPLVYCEADTGERGWQWRAFEATRPLYGLNWLVALPEESVLVVEGEKCADAARILLGYGVKPESMHVPVTWPGGCKAVGKADFTPLAGRDVVLWPDNDEPGRAAMLAIAETLRDVAKSVTMLKIPEGRPQGWDIADAVDEGWDAARLVEFMTIERCDPETLRASIDSEENKHTASVARPPAGGGNSEAGAPPGPPVIGGNGSFHLSDSGNASRLVRGYGDMMRYNAKPFSKWFIWRGNRWDEDRTNLIYEYVDRVVQDIYREANEQKDSDDRKRLWKHAFGLESMGRQRAMVTKAETIQEIAVELEALDRDPYLFNCRNVTLDLRDGRSIDARPHRQDDYITKMANVTYDAKATCPRWEKFLSEIFAGNEELIPYMARAVGYSLTGDTSEQHLFFAYGTGANGKSVFFNTMEMLFGDYWVKTPTDMLMQQKFSQIPTDVADLRGKRFAVCAELPGNKRFDEERIKDLTGSDTIKARRMREDFFDFKPTHKLWMYGNNKPNITGTDEGIWRRPQIIPFTVTIPPEKRLPMRELMASFERELSGILNWALEGYIDYREGCGLRPPDVVQTAVKAYRADMDVLGQFIDECCFVHKDVSCVGNKLWQKYKGWCDTTGEHALNGRSFYAKLRDRGFEVRPGTNNKTTIYGIDAREAEIGD